MILYFADRQLGIVGSANSELEGGIRIIDDSITQNLQTGVASIDFSLSYEGALPLGMIEVGYYVICPSENAREHQFFQILTTEANTDGKTIDVYAEDAGLELLNTVVQPYSAESAQGVAYYVNMYLEGTSFQLGINEIESRSRKLSWDGSATLTERLRSICNQFDAELGYRFDIDDMTLKAAYIDIYKERGAESAEQLTLGSDVTNLRIVTSAENIATALDVYGATPQSEPTQETQPEPITLRGVEYDDGDIYVTSAGLLCSRSARAKWGKPTSGGIRDLVQEWSYDTLSQTELLNRAVNKLNRIKEETVNYEVECVIPVELGGYYNIVDREHDVFVTLRVLETRESRVHQTFSATFGDYLIEQNAVATATRQIVESTVKENTTGQFATLYALQAYIADLRAENIDADYITATRAEVGTLTADVASISELVADQATVDEAIIRRLNTDEANIQDLQATKADIGDLNAATANITSLNGDVANIKTIMSGNVGTGTLQTITLNSANTQLDTALIRNLLAAYITVNDLKAGAIDTSKFTIGEDNVIINNRTIQILDENDVVRVQIGLDANDDFTFTLFDDTGHGVLIDADGIHEDAVPDGLIVDSMVADDANIAGSKLDIDSVITSINEDGSETISSTKVWFDEENRSLNAVFGDLETATDNLESTVSSQTTQLQATQGKLSALITDDELERLNTRAYLNVSQGTIKLDQGNVVLGSSAVQRMENNYSYATMEIDGLRASMGSMKTEIDGNIETVESKVAEYKATLDEFSTYVGETYVTTEHMTETLDGALTDYVTGDDLTDTLDGYVTDGDLSNALVDKVTTTQMNSAISQSAQSITSTVTSISQTEARRIVDEQVAKEIGVFGALRVVNDDGTVTYTAQVIKEGQDVHADYPAYCFEWSTISGSVNREVPIGTGYSVTVNPKELSFGGTVVGVFSTYEPMYIVLSAGTINVSQGALVVNVS